MTENEEELESNDDLDIKNVKGTYPYADIKMIQAQYSVYELKRKFDNPKRQDIVIDPDFQREKVWSKVKQKSELIESILMGIPLPIIYLFENSDGKKEVVDGRQRITTLIDFLDNKFALTDLKIIPELESLYFDSLDPLLQAKIEDYQLITYIIQPPTPERVKFDIFDRVNRGGTRLNNQEMRNALYRGNATILLKELSALSEFKKATDFSIKSDRMKDKYMILRFIGFYLYRTSKLKVEYKSDIDEFLASTMKYLNSFERYEDILYLKELFIKSINLSYKMFKGDGFRFPTINNTRPINTPLFEVLLYLYSLVDDNNIDITHLKKDVKALKKKFDDSKYFTSSVESANSMKYRFELVEELGQKYVK